MKKYCLLILVVTGLWSCASNPKEKEIVSYDFKKINTYVRYIAQTRELQAEITFRTDSTIQLNGPVLFGETPMTAKKLPVVGMQYRLLKERVNFENSYSFSYQEKDGRRVGLSTALGKFQNIKVVSKGGVSRSKGGLLTWDGDVLGQEDGLVFIFTDVEGSTFQINHAGITKGTKFEILPVHAERLAKGKASVLVTRKRTQVEKDSKGNLKMARIEYYLPAIEFEVID